MREVLEEHKAVFEEDLGTLKGFEAKLRVDPGAKAHKVLQSTLCSILTKGPRGRGALLAQEGRCN